MAGELTLYTAGDGAASVRLDVRALKQTERQLERKGQGSKK